ncbi:MAG TPA: DUF4097 family beta strand repeat-containing protein [Thermoanaerobaculia bacterium]|nr:DUF4097 family beta strand repeat-containing protein [Thermoanaerobaculia bacterium]
MPRLHRTRLLAAAFVLLAPFSMGAAAQEWATSTDDSWCRDSRPRDRDRDRQCEIRITTLPASGALAVDAGANGGITVEGTDAGEVRIRAKVETRRGAQLEDVTIDLGAGHVETQGPERGDWSVSFRIEVPHGYDLDLVARNGGLRVAGVDGQVRLETTNGGITLASMAGEVRGRTTNGGISVALDGDTWHGDGLDVETSNGGVHLSVPADYSAELVTGTVNGQLHLGFPVTVEGALRNEVRGTLGRGGPTVRAMTTNGGVKLTRAG